MCLFENDQSCIVSQCFLLIHNFCKQFSIQHDFAKDLIKSMKCLFLSSLGNSEKHRCLSRCINRNKDTINKEDRQLQPKLLVVGISLSLHWDTSSKCHIVEHNFVIFFTLLSVSRQKIIGRIRAKISLV